MNKKWKHICRFAWVSMLIAILVFPGSVMAEGTAGGVTVEIPVTVKLENSANAVDPNFEVTITSEEEGNPTPAEEPLFFKKADEDGEELKFVINYQQVGDYYYTVTQTQGTDKNYYHYDNAVYHVIVQIMYDNEGALTSVLWVEKEGVQGKENQIIFENEHLIRPLPPEPTATPIPTATPEPTTTPGETNPTVSPSGDNNQPTDKSDATGSRSEKKSKNPKTGDETPIALFTALAVVAVLGILYILRRRHRE